MLCPWLWKFKCLQIIFETILYSPCKASEIKWLAWIVLSFCTHVTFFNCSRITTIHEYMIAWWSLHFFLMVASCSTTRSSLKLASMSMPLERRSTALRLWDSGLIQSLESRLYLSVPVSYSQCGFMRDCLGYSIALMYSIYHSETNICDYLKFCIFLSGLLS